MTNSERILAWIEQASGARVPVTANCSIGRLSSNHVVLANERVSRRHALINVQDDNEFWLVDLGSGNGTYLNGRRVVQPTRLRDGDRIEIAAFQLSFHQVSTTEEPVQPLPDDDELDSKTIQQIQPTDCWLLVADIEDSTQLMKDLSESDLPQVTGQWLDECKQLVEDCGGSVNKFLGDGFLAYWRETPEAMEQIALGLEGFAKMRASAKLSFRTVLHFGRVFMGGTASLGEDSLQGKEVHFVFRMEKLAGSMGTRCLISQAAGSRLLNRLNLEEIGSHAVASFDGEHLFYSVKPSP